MDITIFLMQIWGVALLSIGIGFFTSRRYYTKIYRNLESQSFAVFMFAIAAIAVGIAHIHAHNVWATFPEAVISFLGWGTLAKGIIFAVAPKFVDRTAEWEAKSKLIPTIGLFMVVVGAWLSWMGFMA